MDRNQAIGFVLIAVIFIIYFQFFTETPVEPIENKTADTKIADPIIPSDQEDLLVDDFVAGIPDSSLNEQLSVMYGDFAKIASGTSQTETIENSKLEVRVNSKGGQIELASLKDYVTSSGQHLHLIEPGRSRFSWQFQDLQNRTIDLNKLYYNIRKKSDSELELTGDIGNGRKILISYRLDEDSYSVQSQIKLQGMENSIRSETLNFAWVDRIKNQEKDIEISRANSTIKYYTSSGDFDYITERSLSLEEETINEPLKWISVKQKFFTAGIIPEKQFNRAFISTVSDESDTSTVKIATVQADLPMSEAFAGTNLVYFFGPNDYEILSGVAEDFNKNIYLGWPPVNLVNKWILIPLFNILSSFLSNYGLIIIIMVLIIKLALSPLSYKSYLSMAKMKVLKPELDEIKERNKDDMTKAQQEQMSLYRQVGVNPISGCIPLLLQMPILFAMFYLFPQSIELRQKGFLWADDLSTYDAFINLPFHIPGYGDHVSLFVLLMTVSTILYTWSNNQVSSVQGPMKTFSYLMPIIFLFVLNSFPAALSFYYFVSNLVTFGQQALIRRFVDEEKIRDVLDLNRKKNANKKKSTFQLKLEEAMKTSDAKKKKKK